jgi:hypothetical protein
MPMRSPWHRRTYGGLAVFGFRTVTTSGDIGHHCVGALTRLAYALTLLA